MSAWTQNAPDSNLIVLQGTFLKKKKKSMDVVVVVAMKGLTLSKTVFGWHLGVIEHSHEQQNSRFSTRTLQYSCDPSTHHFIHQWL